MWTSPTPLPISCIVVSAKMSTFRNIEVRSGVDGASCVSWESYSAGAIWDLKNMTFEDISASDGLTRFQFKLELKRMRTYYVVNIIIPVLFLSLTSSLAFYLLAGAGKKVGMSMALLLVYSVYLIIIADNMPQTSKQGSFLAVYLIILLAVTTMGVIWSVAVLRLHHTNDDLPVGTVTGAFIRCARHCLRLENPHDVLINKEGAMPLTPARDFNDCDSMSTATEDQAKQWTPAMQKRSSELGFLNSRDQHESPITFASVLSMSTTGEKRETIT